MKKFMIYGSLVTFLFNPLYAVTQQPTDKTDNKAASAANGKGTQPAATSDSSTNSAADKDTADATAPVSKPADAAAPAQADNTKPAANNLADNHAAVTSEQATQPAAAASSTTPTAPAAAQPVNCSYHIAPDVTNIDEKTIKQWAVQAAQQSFQFDYAKLDSQLSSLQLCYTEQGWQSFQDALTKSGNMEAIKNQQLTVTNVVDGEPMLSQLKDNQWKVTLPLQATYQNGKEKLTQSLTLDLVIGRKISGDLGIMQIIASPRKTNTTPEASAPPAPSAAPAPAVAASPTPAAPATQPTVNH